MKPLRPGSRALLVLASLAALWLAPGLGAEPSAPEERRAPSLTATNGTLADGAFRVPYRLLRKWAKFASAPDEAIEERVLQAGLVLSQPLFNDVEIKGNTIYLWVPVDRAFADPDRWSLYADLADMMVVRCRCVDGTAVVSQHSAVLVGERLPVQHFRFDTETGRSRIAVK
jgi:hypothetical protein